MSPATAQQHAAAETSQLAALQPTFEAGHRVWRVRLIMLLSLLWAGGGLWAAYATYVHVVGAGGEPVALAERLGLTLFIALVAIAFPVAMDIYARCYVVRAAASPDGQWHCYTTLRWWGERREMIHKDALGKNTYHEGKFHLRDSSGLIVTPRVEAPYRSQRVRRRRLPYILDDRGFYLDRAAR
jgi:hypothetical protein